MNKKNIVRELSKITSAVARAENRDEQVSNIVDAISSAIEVDVCSLYIVGDKGALSLLASHGLNRSHPITIPHGRGLVGHVVREKHAINLASAEDHPDYYYVEGSGEESFRSFCAVPLVDHGQVVGVLVVQSKEWGALDEEREAFLETLAFHLVIILRNYKLQKKHTKGQARVMGVSGAPGVVIATVKRVSTRSLDDVGHLLADDPLAEKENLSVLIDQFSAQIDADKKLFEKATHDEISTVYSAMQLFLNDPQFKGLIEGFIESGQNIPSALKSGMQHLVRLFEAMSDEYLRTKAEDVRYLCNRLYKLWLDSRSTSSAVAEGGSYIIVGKNIDISHLSAFSGNLLGVISSEGSALSHVSVIANALGVPALLGVAEVQLPEEGKQIILDGSAGFLIVNPSASLLSEYRSILDNEIRLASLFESVKHLPCETIDGESVELMVNTGLMSDISPGIEAGAAGVGLYRTEIPFLIRDSFPTEDEQVAVYSEVISAYKDKPVYMRTLDIGGDKQLSYFPMEEEQNPALGWRGIRFSLDNVSLLMTQIRAILRAAANHESLGILLPMVTRLAEIESFNGLLDEAIKQLQQEGVAVIRPKIGVMVEVPAAISQIPFWKDTIDFIAIGTNDLNQYLLAVDRNNHKVSYLFDNTHPAVIHEIARIARLASENQIAVCVCGEMASDPISVALLLGMGIRRLSLSSSKIMKVRYFIRHMDISRCEELLKSALTMDSPDAIRCLVEDYISTICPLNNDIVEGN